MVSLLTRNAITGIFLALIALGVDWLNGFSFRFGEMYLPIILTASGTFVFMIVLDHAGKGNPKDFIRYFLLLSVVKFIFYISFIVFVLLVFPINPRPFLLTFLLCYFVFTASSVLWMMSKNRPVKSATDL